MYFEAKRPLQNLNRKKKSKNLTIKNYLKITICKNEQILTYEKTVKNTLKSQFAKMSKF